MAKKIYPRVEKARRELDYAELSRLGKLGAKARWAGRRVLLEQKEELEQMKEDRLLAEIQNRLRQGNEDWCPSH